MLCSNSKGARWSPRGGRNCLACVSGQCEGRAKKPVSRSVAAAQLQCFFSFLLGRGAEEVGVVGGVGSKGASEGKARARQ